MLFGIGGGIGFAYFLFEKAGAHPIHLGTRIHTKETEKPDFLQTLAGRIAVPLRLQNSSSATAAAANLKRQLERSQLPIVSVDPVRLPYLGLNAALHTYYTLIVYGIDDSTGQVMVSDRCTQPVTLTQDQLRSARETSWSPKYRAVLLDWPEREPDPREAVMAGLRSCCEQLNEGLGITNFGIRGMEKWATVLTSSKEKKSWPKIFSPGPTLYDALYSIFAQISCRSATGNAHRAFYADFLDEAAGILANPGLRDAAQNYRNCDAIWGEVADAHLPSSAPLFAEAKELTKKRKQLFETQGPDAFDEIESIRQRLEQIAVEASMNFPVSFQDSRTLLNELRQRVLKLREAEAEALRSVESAIGAAIKPLPRPQELEPVFTPSYSESHDAEPVGIEMTAKSGAE